MTKRFIVVIVLGFIALLHAAEEVWGNDEWGDSWEQPKQSLFHGFAEIAGSSWIDDNTNEADAPLEEARLRVDWEQSISDFDIKASGELWHDSVINHTSAQFREAHVAFTLGDSTDVKMGRQILTWGTGDLIFINDLFPKDWQSFFSGRDDEYLKAPSDAIRSSWYGEAVNLDFVISPEFDSDQYLTGERFSFYFPDSGIVQPENPIAGEKPKHKDYEIAARVFKNIDGAEWAAYAYRGFYKSPEAFNEFGQPRFSRLNVLGASLRQSAFDGIVNVEFGYYDSVPESRGNDPMLPNDQFRALAGYETELVKNLTGSFQFYVEKTMDYAELITNSLTPELEQKEWRTLLTTRLTHQAFQQNLITSAFVFYSPSDHDWHLRLKSDYRITDKWKFSAGGYFFGGDKQYTFWSQFQENSSIWVRLKYQY